MKPPATPAGSQPPGLVPLDLIGTGILLAAPHPDAEFVVGGLNERAAELLRLGPAALRAPLAGALTGALGAQVLEGLRACRAAGREQELEVQAAESGPARWLRIVLAPQPDAQGALRQIVATVSDVTGRKQAEAQTLASELKFTGLVEGSIQGVFVMRRDRALFCNAAGAELLGYAAPAQVLRLPNMRELIHQDDREGVSAELSAMARGERPAQRRAYRCLRADGATIWVESFPSQVMWDGAPALQVALHDVTERHRAEAALQESEERYRTVVESSLQGIVVSQGGNPIFANDPAARMGGFDSAAALLAASWAGQFPLVAPEDLERVLALTGSLMAGAQDVVETDVALRGKDGAGPIAHVQTRRVRWQGQPAMITTFIDVTERRRAEAALEESEARYRTLVENSLQGIAVHVDGKYVFANDVIAHLAGFENAAAFIAAVAERPFPLVGPADRERALALAASLMAGRRDVVETDVTLQRRQGEPAIVHLLACRVRWLGQPAMMTTLVDITQRRRAEIALEESETRYRTLVESAPIGIMVHEEARGVFCNGFMARVLGYERAADYVAAAAQREPMAHVPGPRRAEAVQSYLRLQSGAQDVDRDETVLERKDATPMHAQTEARRIVWNGRPAVLTTFLDVTAYKRLEAELRESQALLQAVFDALPVGVAVKDREQRFIMVNPVQARGMNFPMERLGRVSNEDIFWRDEEHRRKVIEEDRRVIELGERVEQQGYAVTVPDGRTLRMNTIKVPVRAPGGQVLGLVVVNQNVTELWEAREQARQRQALLEAVFDALPVGVSVKDREQRFIMVNAAQARTIDFPLERLGSFRNEDIFWRNEEQRQRVIEEDRRVIEEDVRMEREAYALTLTSGRTLWLNTVKVPVHDADGQVVGLVVVNQNITELWEAREQARQRQALLEAVFDAIPLGISFKDREQRFIMVNAAQARALDFPMERLGSFRNQDAYWLDEEEKRLTSEEDSRVIEQGVRAEHHDHPLTLMSGRALRLNIYKVPVRDADGQVVGLVVVNENVTDLWEAREQARQRQALLEAVFDAMPVWLTVKDVAGRYLLVSRMFAAAARFPMERLGEATDAELSWSSPEHHANLARTDQQVIQSGRRFESSAVRLDYSVTGLDRDHEWWHIIKAPVADEQGRVVALVSISMDVTETMDARETLRASEERYRTLVESSLEGITVHQDGVPVLVNDTYAHLLGYADAAACLDANRGKVLPHLAPEVREEGLRRARELEAGELQTYTWERPTVRLDGERRDLYVQSSRIQWNGRPAVLSTFLDVTERKHAAEILRASEERYRALVEGSVQGIGVYSLQDHHALFVNQAMLTLVGAQSAQDYLASAHLLDNIREPHLGLMRTQIERMAAGELERFEDELLAHRSGAQPYWAGFIARRVSWDGEPAVQFTVLDISDHKRAEEALKDRQALLSKQNEYYRQDLSRLRGRPDQAIVAESPAMRRVLHEADMVARSRVPVLIEGATGTGKEVVAEFIHRHSDRGDHLLSVVNCGALSETLMDAELFGHERGAFTGATEARAGLIEIADSGTLFLDEIGDLPPSAQVRLLRFLERGVVRRVGSTRERKVDVRILAATHKTLKEQVAAGTFREDLYHRLLVIRIEVPRLRERIEDILPLAHRFCALACQEAHLEPMDFDEPARHALTRYDWPGNVRELAHSVQRAVFAAQLEGATELRPEHLDLPHAGPSELLLPIKEVVRRAEQQHVRAVLRHHGGNRRQAAETLGISERHLYRLLA
jgi:PAS domain S-box-containing protein